MYWNSTTQWWFSQIYYDITAAPSPPPSKYPSFTPTINTKTPTRKPTDISYSPTSKPTYAPTPAPIGEVRTCKTLAENGIRQNGIYDLVYNGTSFSTYCAFVPYQVIINPENNNFRRRNQEQTQDLWYVYRKNIIFYRHSDVGSPPVQ